jgi:hypothetical protein
VIVAHHDLRLAWTRAVFAVVGAFFLAFIGGSFVASVVGGWHLPITGASAAFAVVVATYFFSPQRPLFAALVALAAGALVAYTMVGPELIPYRLRVPGQPIYVPFLATLAGGCVAALFAWMHAARGRMRNGVDERGASHE